MYIYVSWAFKLRGSVDASVPMHSRYVGDRAEERIFERDPLNKQGLVTDRISIIFNSDFLARTPPARTPGGRQEARLSPDLSSDTIMGRENVPGAQ